MNELDHIIKNKLRQHASDVPDHIWDRIEEEQDRKRRGIIWLWSGVGMALFLLTFLMAYQLSELNTPLEISEFKIIEPQKLVKKSEFKQEIKKANTIEIQERTSLNLIEKLEKENQENRIKKTVKNQTQKENKTQTHPIVKKEFFEKNNYHKSIEIKKIEPLKPNVYSTNKFDLEYIKPSKEEHKKKDIRKRYSFEFLAGTGIHQNNLIAKKSIFENYRTARDTTESERLGYMTSIRFAKHWKSGLFIRSGINYMLINEKFHWKKVEQNVSRFGPADSEDEDIEYGTWEKTTYNRNHFIDIPLLIGYEIKKEKWGIYANIGPSINLWFHQKGDILSPGRRPVSIDKNSKEAYPVFKKRAGFSLWTSMGISYGINSNTSILIEPYLNIRLSDLSTESYQIRQQHKVGGIALGLQKYF